MAEPDPFLAILRKHFPNAHVPDHESLWTGEFIDDETQLPVADREEQEAALKAIEAHLRSAQVAYRSLHPEVRRALDASPGVQLFLDYVDRFGLDYTVVAAARTELPAYDGPLDLPAALPAGEPVRG